MPDANIQIGKPNADSSLPAQLFAAVSAGNADEVERLLAAGADPNGSITPEEYVDWIENMRRDRGESTPMVWDDQTLRWYQDGCRPDEGRGFYPLFEAFNSPPVLELLLKAGAHLDVRSALENNTPLHELAEHFFLYDHSYESVPLLFAAGAPPLKTFNNAGHTPLLEACWRKSDGSLLSALLAHGAGFWDESYIPWPKDSRDEYINLSGEEEEEEFEPLTLPWGARDAVNALIPTR